jgi:hypothetical protein
MIKIKKFENFINDDIRDFGSTDYVPKFNPAVNQKVIEYVDDKLKSNDFIDIFNAAGVKAPKDLKGEEMDKLFDDVREKAIKYFNENPEEIGKPIKFNTYAVNGGDGVPRIRNV